MRKGPASLFQESGAAVIWGNTPSPFLFQKSYKRNTQPTIETLEAICRGFGITLSQFFAEGDMVEMSPDLKELFENWVSLTIEQKKATLTMIKAFHSGK